MALDFYHCDGSPPCLAVMLTGEFLGVKFNCKNIDLAQGQHLTPEFLKLNPMHQVPVLIDNGFVMTESRAIMQYLVSTYGKEEHQTLCPVDPKKRYLVDRMLYFEVANLYASFSSLYYPRTLFNGKLDDEKVKKVNQNLEYLDSFLNSDHPFVAGDEVTLADFSLMACLCCMETIHEETKNYQNVMAYIHRCQEGEEGITFFRRVSQQTVLWHQQYKNYMINY